MSRLVFKVVPTLHKREMGSYLFVLVLLRDAWVRIFGYNIQHSVEQLKVCVIHSEVAACAACGCYSLSDGNDYDSVSGKFIFSSGSVDGDAECIDVDIINDDILEAKEFFTIVLCSNHSAVNICVPSAEVCIEDEDGE